MIKRLLIYLAVALVLATSIYFLHVFILNSNDLELSFPLLNMYIFHFISSLIVYAVIEFIFDILPDQTGFGYLASVFLKIGFFVMIFQSIVFGEVELLKYERISVIIPLFVFLILEAMFSFRLLNEEGIILDDKNKLSEKKQ